MGKEKGVKEAVMKEFNSENAERAELIVEMLDQIMPIPERAPKDVKDAIDVERQSLAMRAGWLDVPIEELRARAGK